MCTVRRLAWGPTEPPTIPGNYLAQFIWLVMGPVSVLRSRSLLRPVSVRDNAMKLLFEFVSTYCTGLFAGAALYVTLVEHPARLECGTELAVAEFAPSYRRGAVIQALLAALAFLAAVAAWVTDSKSAWLLGAILIVAVIPFTLLAILPTNKKLLTPPLDRNSDSARQLLIRWGRLHLVRTLLSLMAFAVFPGRSSRSNEPDLNTAGPKH
jgi:hypothetical protein